MLVNGHSNEQLGGKYLDGGIGGWVGERTEGGTGRDTDGQGGLWLAPDSVGLPAAAGPGDHLSPSGPPP